MAAGDTGQLNHAVVLRKDRAGEGVEQPSQQRVGAVDQHAALDPLHPQRAFHRLARDLAGSGHITNGFQRGHQVDHQHRNEQRPRETQAEMQRYGHLEQRSFVHAGEVQAAQVTGQGVTHGQGDDDGAAAHPHHRNTVEDHDDRQHHARQQEVLAIGEGAVAHRRKAAAHTDQADLDQGQADHQHDDTGHQRGNQAFDEGQNARNAHLHERTGNHHTKNRRHHAFNRRALLDHQRATGDQRPDKVEAGALHNQKPGAKRPEATALHESGDPGDHQRHRHDQVGITGRNPQRLANQQARGDDRHNDRQQVLQRRQHRDQRTRPVFKAEDQFIGLRGCAGSLLD
ncbi:hypothetical protein D3C80_1197670 [compost metagenome]